MGKGYPCPEMGQTTRGNSFRRLLHRWQSYGSRPTAGGCDQLNTESHAAQAAAHDPFVFRTPRPCKAVREPSVRSGGEPGPPSRAPRARAHTLSSCSHVPSGDSSDGPQAGAAARGLARGRSESYEDALISPRERVINALALPTDPTYTGPVARILASAFLRGRPAQHAAARSVGFHALDR